MPLWKIIARLFAKIIASILSSFLVAGYYLLEVLFYVCGDKDSTFPMDLATSPRYTIQDLWRRNWRWGLYWIFSFLITFWVIFSMREGNLLGLILLATALVMFFVVIGVMAKCVMVSPLSEPEDEEES